MIEINLVPDVKQELLRAQRTRTAVITISIISGLAAIGIVVLLLVYVFGVQAVRSGLADNAIKEQSEKLASVEDLSKILTIQNQLEQIDLLNEGKKLDSRLFDMLQAVIPPEPNQVQIVSLSLDADNSSIVIEGQTPAYDNVEIFKKTIEGAVVTYPLDGEEQSDQLATDVSLREVSYGEDASGQRVVRFTLSFAYPDSLLAASIDNMVIKLTNEGNVTDSYLGIPRSVFVTDGGAE